MLNTLLPGLDVTRLFISLTAGAGTRCMEPSLKARFVQQINSLKLSVTEGLERELSMED